MADHYLTDEQVDQINDLEQGFELLRSFNTKIQSVNTISEIKSKLKSIIRSQFQQGKDYTTILSTAVNSCQQKCQSICEMYQKAQDAITTLDQCNLDYIALRINDYKSYLHQSIHSLKSGSNTICLIDYCDCSSQSCPFLSVLLANTEIPISSCIPVTDICLIRYSDHKRLILTPYTTDLDQTSQDKQSFQPQICELDDYQSFEEQACYYLERYQHQNKFKLIEIEWPLPSLKEGCQIVNMNGLAYNTATKNLVIDWLQSSILRIHIVRDIARLNAEMNQLIQGLHSFNDMKTLALWSDSSIVIYDCNMDNSSDKSCQYDHIQQITSKLQNIWPEWKKIPIYAINIHQEKNNIDHHQMTDVFYQLLHQCKKTIHDHCKLKLEIYYRWLHKLLNYAQFTDRFRQYCHKLSNEERKLHQSQLQIKLIDIARILRKTNAKLEPTTLSDVVKSNVQDFLQALNLKLLRFLNENNSTFLDKYSVLCNPIITNSQDITSMIIDELDLQVTQLEIENKLLLVAKHNYIKELLASYDNSTAIIHYFENLMLGLDDYQYNVELTSLQNTTPSPTSVVDSDSKMDIFLRYPILFKASYPTSISLFITQHQDLLQTLQQTINEQPRCHSIKQCITNVLHHFTDDHIQCEMVNHELRPFGYIFHQWLDDLIQLTEYYASLIQGDHGNLDIINVSGHDHTVQSKSSIIKNLQRSVAFYRVQYIQKDTNYYNQDDLDTISVENIVGTGIIGHCYHGIGRIDKSNPIPVLIKRLHDDLNKDNALEYVIEMDALRKLKHKNIIQYYGSIHRYGRHLRIDMLLETCRRNLRNILESNHQLISSNFTTTGYPKYRARLLFANLSSQIVDGLQFLHSHGYLHRDLRLDNVLINDDFIVKLTEIGQAYLSKTATGNAVSNSIIYQAPEIYQKQFINQKADIYSFGLMIWEMWYGKRAFSQDFEIKLILQGHRPSLDTECQPERHLKDLIQSCWDGDPKCRPSSQKCYHILRNYFNDLTMLDIGDLLPQVRGRIMSRAAACYAHKKTLMPSESVIYRV